MNLSIDKARIFAEEDDVETVDVDNATFKVDERGNLVLYREKGALHPENEAVGYFPAGQWACVYIREEEE